MISGKIIEIRGIIKDDIPLILNWTNNEELRTLTGTVFPISEYEHEAWAKNINASNSNKLFSVYYHNKCIGTIGIKNIDYINSNAELYIRLGVDIKGAGSDAVVTLVRYCFMTLNLHKIYLKVFESNKRAINCYKKSGLIVEGKLKNHHFINGHYEDVIVMGIINET